MKLQLFSTGKELPPQAHPLFADQPAAVFPALLLTMSSPIWISMITAYGIRARIPACQRRQHGRRQSGTMAICWLWTVLNRRGTADIVCRQRTGGVYGETASADAATDAAAHECLLVADLS